MFTYRKLQQTSYLETTIIIIKKLHFTLDYVKLPTISLSINLESLLSHQTTIVSIELRDRSQREIQGVRLKFLQHADLDSECWKFHNLFFSKDLNLKNCLEESNVPTPLQESALSSLIIPFSFSKLLYPPPRLRVWGCKGQLYLTA